MLQVNTLIACAASGGSVDMLRYLLEDVGVTFSPDHSSPVSITMSEFAPCLATSLSLLRVPPQSQGDMCPLWNACEKGKWEAARFLVPFNSAWVNPREMDQPLFEVRCAMMLLCTKHWHHTRVVCPVSCSRWRSASRLGVVTWMS